MKYYNKKTIIDGIVFASKLEAKRYTELKLLEKQGIIKDLELQPSYDLIPSFKKDNKTYRKSTYKADFSYFDIENNKTIVEDTKGFKTPVYMLKKKLFEYNYPNLTITEIKR
jgi:transposase